MADLAMLAQRYHEGVHAADAAAVVTIHCTAIGASRLMTGWPPVPPTGDAKWQDMPAVADIFPFQQP
ncbi:MAG: hypothetical protein ACREPY_14230 [Rhodanobacteraceae bacterium]